MRKPHKKELSLDIDHTLIQQIQTCNHIDTYQRVS
jgi:hypothetical protein